MANKPESEELQRPHTAAERVSLYWAVTLGYDAPPKHKEEGVEVDVRQANLEPGSPAAILWNRQNKIVAPPTGGKWSLYLDGSLLPTGPIKGVVEGWLRSHEAAFFTHPKRTCAYEEIDACVRLHKITAEQGAMAREGLKRLGHPKDYGLWACGMIARRSASELHAIFANVWYHLLKLCPRDQIWLPHVIREHGLRDKINTIDADVFNNKWFRYRRHGT